MQAVVLGGGDSVRDGVCRSDFLLGDRNNFFEDEGGLFQTSFIFFVEYAIRFQTFFTYIVFSMDYFSTFVA